MLDQSRRSPRSSGRREAVLATLRAAPTPLEVAAIALKLGVHPNTVRFHLAPLIEDGQVEQVDASPSRQGRPPVRFRARRAMDSRGPRNYRLLAEMLLSTLAAAPDPVSEARLVGSTWGRRLASRVNGGPRASRTAALLRLTALLDELGFAPEPAIRRKARWELRLSHCPFLDLLGAYPGLICELHLGLMRGALEGGSLPLTVDRLQPFVEPDRCVASIVPVTSAR